MSRIADTSFSVVQIIRKILTRWRGEKSIKISWICEERKKKYQIIESRLDSCHVLHAVHAPGNILREGAGFRFECILAGSSLESLWPRRLCKRISGHSARRGQDECTENSATRRTQYNRGLGTIARQSTTGNFHRVLSTRMHLSSRTHAWNWCSAASPCPNNLFSHFVPTTNLLNPENTRYEFLSFSQSFLYTKNS